MKNKRNKKMNKNVMNWRGRSLQTVQPTLTVQLMCNDFAQTIVVSHLLVCDDSCSIQLFFSLQSTQYLQPWPNFQDKNFDHKKILFCFLPFQFAPLMNSTAVIFTMPRISAAFHWWKNSQTIFNVSDEITNVPKPLWTSPVMHKNDC